MAENSKIEWTHHTFNPWHGCSKVSPGCDNCYAERDSKRFNGDKVLWGVNADRLELSDSYWKQPIKWDKRSAEKGVRERVFCASMADVFDKNAPEGARERLWALIKATPNLDWLLLTKRIGNAKTMLPDDWGKGYPNVWLVISVVNQEEADRDIPKLLDTPAKVRGLSMEPLLGEVKLDGYFDIGIWKYGIDWVIVGGESGNEARPMHPEWVVTLRDQCKAAGVPFFFKQWGEWEPSFDPVAHMHMTEKSFFVNLDGSTNFGIGNAGCAVVKKIGKKAAGRMLDGKTYDEYPEVNHG